MEVDRKTKKRLLKLAGEIAEGYGLELNLSEESLHDIDRILEDIHVDFSKDQNNPSKQQGAQGIALEMAAYIIEVIEHHHGKGVWRRDDEAFGEDTWPYSSGEKTIFPVAWCLKRIQEGASHSVWDKYIYTFRPSNL